MSRTFDRVVWGIAFLLLVPVLLSPAGWAIGVTFALGWLVLVYGGRELWSMEKKRREGERGLAKNVRHRGRGGNE